MTDVIAVLSEEYDRDPSIIEADALELVADLPNAQLVVDME